MKTRKLERVLTPPPPHMVGDGFRVHQYIPGGLGAGFERMDPFIMMDYNSKFYFSPTDKPRGVDVHPHRGFETVTIAYKGSVAHHDSAGNSGVIAEGDVQWMTAASGILHKEYHEKNFSKAGGDFQMVQLWINLPAKYKMTAPKYQGLTNAEMKKVQLPNNAGIVEVIAGEFNGEKGPAFTFTPVHMLNAKLNKNGNATFSFPETFNTVILVVEGNIKVNNSEEIKTDGLGLFKNEGDTFTIEALDNAVVLVLSGQPINEPIAAQGPFVMNTRAELIQAISDFNMGKFGYLE
ncbi:MULTISPECIES: pirin family protein [Aequorivita]|uniref:Pirin family protein n=1 Tax=Aequorivita iocasae TaxID=2803865 RepID=A0ABX7DQH8_9FLAO|nr:MULTISPECIES: pirin family protein [Aequorivita]QQX76263.1 pirin family protein [Aequorivita iocasae]UCA55726.1 pirin family protein [Aequorivita sp. F7]